MPNSLEEWISHLREEDAANTRDFLTASCDYFDRNGEFLAGSGFYVVGSSLTGATCIAKEDVLKKDKLMSAALFEELNKRFGEERVGHVLRFGRDAEVERAMNEGWARIREEAPKREWGEYGDIDFVIAGLPHRKSDVDLDIWKDYIKTLNEKFPNAQHPDKFGNWCIGGLYWSYIVQDYALSIPAKTRPTPIHFMLYVGDMNRSDDKDERGNWVGKWHTRLPEMTLDEWKQMQASDNLGYLAIREF